MQGGSADFHRNVALRTAGPMFFVSLLFLAIIATLIVLWVDVPRVSQSQRDQAMQSGELTEIVDPLAPKTPFEKNTLILGYSLLGALAVLWLVFLAEYVLLILFRRSEGCSRRKKYWGLVICFCPPLRLCERNEDVDGKVWLPGLGCQEVSQPLRRRMERFFSVPMILIALMILPVLLVEHSLSHYVASHLWLRILLHVGTGLIWFAFAVEFVVMVSIAEKKVDYCRTHWLDLAIILLPLISFLRSLRVIRATRLARLARLQQLTRMSRLYRLRGLAMRAFRALLILELLNRMVGVTPQKRLRKLQAQLCEKERELDALRLEIKELELRITDADAKSDGELPGKQSESSTATPPSS